MTRNDLRLFAPAYKALSIVVRISRERKPNNSVRHAEWHVNKNCEAIEYALGRFDTFSLEKGLGTYAGANICKEYTGTYESYMYEARKALEAFIVGCEEYTEVTSYLVNSIVSRTFALRKLFD